MKPLLPALLGLALLSLPSWAQEFKQVSRIEMDYSHAFQGRIIQTIEKTKVF